MRTHIDLFSGIGGFALAARWAGIQTIQFVEIDKFCHKVLNKNFPGVPIYEDIKTFTNTNRSGCIYGESSEQSTEGYELPQRKPITSIDSPFLLTGGFPCQPFSCAGKRKGTGDDRHLWPHMLRVIQEFHPRWIIAENVGGIVNIKNMEQPDSEVDMEDEALDGGEDCGTTSVLISILSDLEASGYSVQIFIIPACAVNAPHRRDRVWIVANSKCNGISRERGIQGYRENKKEMRETPTSSLPNNSHAPNTSDKGLQGGEKARNFSIDRKESRNELIGGCAGWQEPWLEVATRLCTLDDGLPGGLVRPKGWRVNALKGAGNAVVPQIPYLIMRAILEVEDYED